MTLLMVINNNTHHHRRTHHHTKPPKQVTTPAPAPAPVAVTNVAANWQNFPAASTTGDKVTFSPIDRKIVNQDGSGGQDNPAVNINTYAEFSGNFAVTYSMSGLSDSPATFRTYAQLPVIYDEWRAEPASLSISVTTTSITVNQWDGRDEEPAFKKTVQRSTTADTANLRIERRDNQVAVLEGPTELAVLPARYLFNSGKLWFGATAGKTWTLDSLADGATSPATFVVHPTSDTVDAPADGLAKLADKKRAGFKVSAAVSLFPLIGNDQYRSLALGQFSMLTTENELKSQFVHPTASQYDFAYSDALVDIAKKNNLAVHGHALVFGEANAKWMQQTSATDLPAVMDDHVSTIVSHYKGKVAEWDVINEPLSDRDQDYNNGGNGLRRHIWYKSMGADYIARALRKARLADPDAKLYINDYGLEEDGDRWDALMKLVDNLQANNVPLDGIGFEAHVYEDGDHINPTVLKKHFAELASKHLLGRISEMDVHGENRTAQAKEYADVFQACLQTANCSSFSTWGISDAYGSTTSDHTYPLEYGNDLLWDKNFAPKPAIASIRNTLTN